jgi:hypothetical protein
MPPKDSLESTPEPQVKLCPQGLDTAIDASDGPELHRRDAYFDPAAAAWFETVAEQGNSQRDQPINPKSAYANSWRIACWHSAR